MMQVNNLKKTYDKRTRNAHQVLHGMSFTLPDTGFVCILGPSGCGKTSLLNAIGGLDRFDSGSITTEHTTVTRSNSRKMEKERNSYFGYIFQNYYLLPEHSVAYNVYLGMHSLPLSKKEKMQRVRVALEKVDMYRYRKRPVGQLSGGQQQRIAIARAIAKSPKVIFADEPTGNLDEANTMNICSILKKLSKDSLVVMVTHEERIARFFADRIIKIEDGRITDDITEWNRGVMHGGVKGAVYSEEYTESQAEGDGVSLRLLTQEGAPPVSLTVIREKDRIIIKTDDRRVVLCSETATPPTLIEGKRPVMTEDSFEGEEEESLFPAPSKDPQAKKGKGLGIRFLLREAKSLVSSRRLGKVGMLVFVVLLSAMLSLSVADMITLSHVNPENFIKTDSHVLELEFVRGEDLPREVWSLSPCIDTYMQSLKEAVPDFDYVTNSGGGRYYIYKDDTVPQMGELSMKMQFLNYTHISRLDPSTLILGRMPQRSDEIVVDRWLLDTYLSDSGILQNIIPTRDYFLGKQLVSSSKSTFSPTVVGICDSGEPAMYLSTEALLSQTPSGIDLMRFSEFCAITGYDKFDTLAPDQCIVLADNAGMTYTVMVGKIRSFGQPGKNLMIMDAPVDVGHGITAKYVVADELVDEMYVNTLTNGAKTTFIWCADKEAVIRYLKNSMPEELEGMIEVRYTDHWAEAYAEYVAETGVKADSRTIVTAAVFLLSLVMLYLMQRSKINEHMDVVAVYRLLGIPKPNLLFVFAVESITVTLKYALPTVLLSWATVNLLSQAQAIDFFMIFPLSAAALTLLAILVIRLLFSMLPVLRLLYDPPAKLAAKHDF